MPTKLILENAKKQKIAFRTRKCIFRHEFPLPRPPFFKTCGKRSFDEYAISEKPATEKYEKLRLGGKERRQIQSKLTEMLMVERQIDADSTNLAKTNKS